MDSLILWVLIAIAVLAVAGGILALLAHRSLLRHTEEAFSREGCHPTRKLGDLWLDEPNRRWTIARDCENLMLHRFEDVTDAHLVQDGETLVIPKSAVESNLGGVVLGAASLATSIGGRPKEKAVQSIVINISLSDRSCPVETMVLHNSLIRFNSRSYRKLCGQASALLAEFDAMQGIQMSGAGKP